MFCRLKTGAATVVVEQLVINFNFKVLVHSPEESGEEMNIRDGELYWKKSDEFQS